MHIEGIRERTLAANDINVLLFECCACRATLARKPHSAVFVTVSLAHAASETVGMGVTIANIVNESRLRIRTRQAAVPCIPYYALFIAVVITDNERDRI